MLVYKRFLIITHEHSTYIHGNYDQHGIVQFIIGFLNFYIIYFVN